MKKVIIIGASGSLARYVIDALKPLANVQLSLFLRNRNRLSKSLTEGCNIIEGNAMKYNEVDYALTQKGEAETGSAISRKSIAAFISTLIENPGLHKNENLGISKPN